MMKVKHTVLLRIAVLNMDVWDLTSRQRFLRLGFSDQFDCQTRQSSVALQHSRGPKIQPVS